VFDEWHGPGETFPHVRQIALCATLHCGIGHRDNEHAPGRYDPSIEE
jgi:hypothetical protein